MMTTRQVADFLGVSTRTVLRWYQARTFPGFRYGGAIRYRRSEIERWLEQRRNVSVTQAQPGLKDTRARGAQTLDDLLQTFRNAEKK